MWYVTFADQMPKPHGCWSFDTCAEAATKAARWIELGTFSVLWLWHGGQHLATITARAQVPTGWVWGSA